LASAVLGVAWLGRLRIPSLRLRLSSLLSLRLSLGLYCSISRVVMHLGLLRLGRWWHLVPILLRLRLCLSLGLSLRLRGCHVGLERVRRWSWLLVCHRVGVDRDLRVGLEVWVAKGICCAQTFVRVKLQKAIK